MKKNKRFRYHLPISYEIVYDSYLRFLDTKNSDDLAIYKTLVKIWQKHLKEHTEFNYCHL